MTLRRVLPIALGIAIAMVVLVISQVFDATSPSPSTDGKGTPSPRSQPSESPSPSEWHPPVRTIEGTGYTYALPHMWYDTTEDATSSPKVTRYLDSQGSWGNNWANVVVYGPYAGVEGDLELLLAQQRDNIRTEFKGEITDSAPRKIGGVTALGLHLVRPLSDGYVSDENHWVLRVDGYVYLIVSRGKHGDPLVIEKFEEIYATWKWQTELIGTVTPAFSKHGELTPAIAPS